MTAMDDAALLTRAAQLAQAAALAIIAVRDGGFAVSMKADATPVTRADAAAEAIITAGLRAATPDIPVVAEEEVAAGRITAPAPAFWLVDPLDGTREFAAGRPDYTVNIALVRNGAAVLGAVALPATGELFGGIVGMGAWRQINDVRRRVTVRLPPPEGLTVMASRHFADDPALAALLNGGPTIARVVNIGSAVKFCRIAEGVADFYPRLGRTYEWDTAAPQAVVEAAGGSVRCADGVPLGYGKPDWVNPPFECRGG